MVLRRSIRHLRFNRVVQHLHPDSSACWRRHRRARPPPAFVFHPGRFLKGRVKSVARILSSGAPAAISAFLCVASVPVLITERRGGGRLAYNIPTWAVELVLPVGFGLVAVRLLGTRRAMAGAGRRRCCWRLRDHPVLQSFAGSRRKSSSRRAGGVLVATVWARGFTTIGGAALILFLGRPITPRDYPLKHYSLVTNPSLPTIPLFTLAGYFLAEAAASRRLVGVFQALFGSHARRSGNVTTLFLRFFTSSRVAYRWRDHPRAGRFAMPVLLAGALLGADALGLLTGPVRCGLSFRPACR